MALLNFEYHAPAGANIACELLNGLPEARLLSGGTWLLNLLKKPNKTQNIIGIRSLPELKGIYLRDNCLHIGAAEIIDDISRNALIVEYVPVLNKAINKMATPQIRNMATLGGNICTCLPWADLPPVLLALNAEFVFLNQGNISCAQFLASPKKYCSSDILAKVIIPVEKMVRYKYLRLPLRNHTDIPFGALSFTETTKGKILTANLGNTYPVTFPQTAAVLEDKNKAYDVFVNELKIYQKDELRLQVMSGLFKEFMEGV